MTEIKKILLVKTSSLGDVIHTFPALTDLQRARPSLEISWVVEANFAEIPRWHEAVNEVIPVHLRRWRKNLRQMLHQHEFSYFYQNLRKKEYDLVVDAQGLIKSALIAKMAQGPIAGFDYRSVRDPFAALFYQQRFQASRKLHAITRIRQLFAKAFEYTFQETEIDYGLEKDQFFLPIQVDTKQPYLVFLTGTSWASKHYPESYWRQLLETAVKDGYKVLLPWGSDEEYQCAQRLGEGLPAVEVLPRLSLTELAAVLAYAQGVVSVDTGLGHFACALALPVVGLYGATDYRLTGMLGRHTQIMAANFECAPCLERECSYTKKTEVKPACFQQITPEKVYQCLKDLIAKKNNHDN